MRIQRDHKSKFLPFIIYFQISVFVTGGDDHEVSHCKGEEVIVHGRVEILALHDDHAHKTVAKDTSEEEEKVEKVTSTRTRWFCIC